MTHHAEIARIKAQVRLEEVCRSRGIELRAAGAERLEGLCPFHDDHTPSFSVYLRTQRYYCFACGAGGDVIDFIRTLERCSFLQALQRLVPEGRMAQLHMRPVSRASGRPARTPRATPTGPSSEEQAALMPMLTSALTVYHHALLRTDPARDYLVSRGISASTMHCCRLGYADGASVLQSLEGHAARYTQAQHAGLLTRHGKEWLTGRVIIPDLAGEQCSWMIGRLPTTLIHPPFKASDKYLGLPLAKPLLGYRQALLRLQHPEGRQGLQAILVVEGAMDYLLAQEWQLPVLCVALLGTHASRQQLHDLLHLQRESGLPLRIWLDADERGREGARHLLTHVAACPASLVPEIDGVKDLADLGSLPNGYVRLQQVWRALTDGGER